jgi:octaprenyl-diphosphate synthase
MRGVVELPKELESLGRLLSERLDQVTRRFDAQLVSSLQPVAQLVKHVERYRGKMLRPSLVLICGTMAHRPSRAIAKSLDNSPSPLTPDHISAAAVCEMVHMATLVHDDVLDEADVRRRGATVNNLYGNEPAVILGDYLFSAAYHLCSQIEDAQAARHAALIVGECSMAMCAGELLQLHNRGNFALSESEYFQIVEGKTGQLIAASCTLGALISGANREELHALAAFGTKLGVAFQIQDDLLDLVGSEASVGKSVHKDLEKGKLTLPIIHHLAAAAPATKASTLELLERAGTDHASVASVDQLGRALRETDSRAAASSTARRFIDEAIAHLDVFADSPARHMLAIMAQAVTERSH